MAPDNPFGLPCLEEMPASVWDGWQAEAPARRRAEPALRAVATGLVLAGLLLLLSARRAEGGSAAPNE